MVQTKFRIRRFFRQYFKENQIEELIIIDTTNFSDHQNKVVMAELLKRKILKNIRRQNKSVSIRTHNQSVFIRTHKKGE